VAGNSGRRGAVRKPGTKKGPIVGSGGQKSRGLVGKGPTPKATERKGHPAARRAAAAERRSEGTPRRRGTAGKNSDAPELLVGRNPVAEALRAAIPANALYVAIGIDADERVTEAIHLAADRGLPILEVSKSEIDRRTGGILHQGIALQVPAFAYDELPDLLELVASATTTPLLVALDGVTDPRNLGAIIRSVAAFGGHGVVVPERRSAGLTASAWKTSAGAAARIPVALASNLTRALEEYRKAGFFILGLDMDGDVQLPDLELASEPLVIVVGSEGKGLSRLVGETCDQIVSIPMSSAVESLNAGIATGVTLYEVARRRAL
jgi:23S rRNA (guanosine2251-2'-O)-methyltransferase